MKNKNLKQHRPKKRWSQNFLRDANIASKIANSLKVKGPALLIEIGPGQGILTRHLLKKANKLLAVEIDPLLAEQLPERLELPSNLEIMHEDFMEFPLTHILSSYPNYKKYVVGNLPYHITSPIIFKVLEQYKILSQAVFTVQKEVARRIAAQPGSKEYGIISVFCQLYSKVEYLFTIPSRVFHPKPQVDSGVLRFTFSPAAEQILVNPTLFREIVRQTFGQRRKMLRNTLSGLFSETILQKLKLDLTRRPETLSVKEFIDLSNQLQKVHMSS
jgi:16S rRNA (adenine1518-N6/adenine1519-N6)-dimethyltransferase